MSVTYQSVLWNAQKKRYHRYMWLGIFILLFSFIGFQLYFQPTITLETLIIRSSSMVAVSLLHFILIIGPLCRLNDAFLPLLYNRRHMGVTLFFFAALHGIFSLIQFHSLGNTSILESLFFSNEKYLQISQFPFQVLGFFALLIFFLMAATSHDFWLKNLGPKIWKSLHMLVYLAYGLVIMHVALGILQYDSHPGYWIGLVMGFLGVGGLHLSAGLKAMFKLKAKQNQLKEEGFFAVCTVEEIEDNAAKTFFIENENIAVFKYENQLSAVNNVCRHQMGPLGEGKIVDGCITCPWHGYQYQPHNGQSPPPFNEKLTTYHLKVIKNTVWVNPKPNPEGTAVEPVKI